MNKKTPTLLLASGMMLFVLALSSCTSLPSVPSPSRGVPELGLKKREPNLTQRLQLEFSQSPMKVIERSENSTSASTPTKP